MTAVVHIAPWFLTLHWAVVVRHTIWFFVTAYFTQVLVRKFHTSDHVMHQNLILGLRVELNFPAVMVFRMDYVEFKGSNIINNKTVRKIALARYFVNMNLINISY